MNIIFSTYETKEVGGNYLRSLSLAKALVKLGNKVTLLTSSKTISFLPRFSNEEEVAVVESIGFFPYKMRKGGFDIADILFRIFFTLSQKVDIVHSFNHRPASIIPGLIKSILSKETKWFIDWADLWGKGGIADTRSNNHLEKVVGVFDHHFEKFVIKYSPNLTAISHDLVKRAKKIRVKKQNLFYLPIGASTDQITPKEKKYCKNKLGLNFDDTTVLYLYIGSYDEQLLAKTFIELNKLRNNAYLILVGPTLYEFNKIISQSEISHLSKKVIYTGIIERSDLSHYLGAADIFLLPFANKEINLGKFPNKLGDYLSAGRPIISNPTGDVEMLMKYNSVGVLVKEDPYKFALSIHKLLNNPKLLKEYGYNARHLAKKMSWLNIAKQLESFYLK